jgi:hypothetical protein
MRRQIELGTIVIDQVVADNAAAERTLRLLPGTLPIGIEIRDPMIEARQASYPISYERRTKLEKIAA